MKCLPILHSYVIFPQLLFILSHPKEGRAAELQAISPLKLKL